MDTNLHRILLVEDVELNQQVMSRMLEQCGCRVTIVGDGYSALEALDNNGFVLVFVDIGLPDINGIEVVKRARGDGHTLPMLALTAHVMEAERQRCLEVGFNQVITKPVLFEQLEAAIERWV